MASATTAKSNGENKPDSNNSDAGNPPVTTEDGEITGEEESETKPAGAVKIVETKSVDQIKKSWRLPSINYRLHEDTEYQRLTFEGETIAVADILKAVAISHNFAADSSKC